MPLNSVSALHHVLFALACGALATAGCSTDTEIPPDLAPLDAVNRATLPGAVGAELFPEVLNVESVEGNDFDSVHAKGYIHAPIAEVWAALQVPDALVDRREVTTWKVESGVIPEAQASFAIENTVESVVTVVFNTTYRLGVVEGSASEPELVAVRAHYTGGTTFIDILDDSMIARPVSDDVTSIELMRNIESLQAHAPEAEIYLKDLHLSLAAKARGETLPTYPK